MRANIGDGYLERVAGGRGKVIITASSANEVSVEKDELQHGVFTYYLLEGLRGKADTDRDGMVTVDEAYRYVYDQVPQGHRPGAAPGPEGLRGGQPGAEHRPLRNHGAEPSAGSDLCLFSNLR
ncbi:MAG: hypothetical protein MZU95_02755 [Desulfomicrobium escambiense]|nr:hypothetical protein [Desulfomicrobium escambiense]